MVTILDVNKKYSVDNYPYGRLHSTATFGVEFKDKKGFRSEFQTINPKNGRLNAMKNGTYSDFMCVTHDSENGHYHWHHCSMNGIDAIVKTLAFISTNFDALQLTREMHQWLASKAIASIMIGNAYTNVANKEEYLNLYFKDNMTALKLFLRINVIINADLYSSIKFDMEGIKKYEQENKIWW